MTDKRTNRNITVDVSFIGSGVIVESPDGRFIGGVPDPELGKAVGFNVVPEVPDETGNLEPASVEGSYDGALQINVWGDSAGLREIGRYFLALAELDTSADSDFHQHHELVSTDGRTLVHLIIRKPGM